MKRRVLIIKLKRKKLRHTVRRLRKPQSSTSTSMPRLEKGFFGRGGHAQTALSSSSSRRANHASGQQDQRSRDQQVFRRTKPSRDRYHQPDSDSMIALAPEDPFVSPVHAAGAFYPPPPYYHPPPNWYPHTNASSLSPPAPPLPPGEMTAPYAPMSELGAHSDPSMTPPPPPLPAPPPHGYYSPYYSSFPGAPYYTSPYSQATAMGLPDPRGDYSPPPQPSDPFSPWSHEAVTSPYAPAGVPSKVDRGASHKGAFDDTPSPRHLSEQPFLEPPDTIFTAPSELIYELREEDVLCGRGAPTLYHPGKT